MMFEGQSTNQDNQMNQDIPINQGWGMFILILVLLWILAGIVAFIMSIVCFGYSGTEVEKIVGLLLAFFLGPFYWIYYYVSSTYCRSKITKSYKSYKSK